MLYKVAKHPSENNDVINKIIPNIELVLFDLPPSLILNAYIPTVIIKPHNIYCFVNFWFPSTNPTANTDNILYKINDKYLQLLVNA